MDRRQIKTKKAIYESFNNLLIHKSYSQITIQNIIDEANIGRSTFYAHFQTKEELREEMCADFFEHVIEKPAEKEKTHDFSHSSVDLKEIVTHILYHIKDSSFVNGLIQGDSSGFFYVRLQEVFSEWCLANLSFSSFLPQELAASFISGNLISLCRFLLKNKEALSPEKASMYFMDSVKDLLS